MAKLRPRARIIRTIGDQLISGPEAAIIELVKNAYDAEASYAEVKFNYTSSESFSIIVKDDGHGMTYDEIVNNWLEPATDIKVKNILSRNGKRKLLGAKGIGRFAVSRLGNISLLTSTSINFKTKVPETSSICVDWTVFSAEKYLDDIEIDIIKENNINDREPGVEIEISDLRDSWSKKQLERLVLELRRLSHPRSNDEFSVYLDLRCFNSDTAGFDGGELFENHNNNLSISDDIEGNKTLIQPYIIGDVADYRLEGTFSIDGFFKGVFQVQRGDNIEQIIEFPAPVLSDDEMSCGEISIKLNAYDREKDSLTKLFERMGVNLDKIGVRRARKILTDMSGISIVRNGFRIRPYGDPEHDWLELQAKRVQDPSKKLGSDQVSGYVEIQDEILSGIVERSSREGLEINGQFRRLKALVLNLLPHIEERRFGFREKAGIGRYPATNVSKAREASKLKQIYKVIDKIPDEFKVEIVTAIKKDATTINEMLDDVDEYQKILQSRSALGLVVAEVIHEGRRQLDPMLTSIKTLKADQKYAFEESEIGSFYRKNFPAEIETLLKGGKGLGSLFKRLDPISGRRRGRPSGFKLANVISDVFEIMSRSLESASIKFEYDDTLDINCYGYREDLHAVLLNIIENASYWLSTVPEDNRVIHIEVRVVKNKVHVSVSNSGPEIDENYRHRLFDAGFSLKSDGTGLGLAIAREACRASKGELWLDESVVDTTFIIEFPKR